MWRSIRAIVIGFVTIAVLSFGADAILYLFVPERFDTEGAMESIPLLILMMVYVGVFAVVGCYVTARLAPRRPMWHALGLGGIGLIFNIVGTFANWNDAPAWYHVVSVGMVMPYAWLGGYIRERELLRSPAAAT
ncbi:MAG TPA: hypothetical protein VE913_10230 [Longimicrobium sp.]|nr:hypothetical protein [Longimicrobium sp.]